MNILGIPVLEMVDNFFDIRKCEIDLVKLNQTINTFIENKKLLLGPDKC